MWPEKGSKSVAYTTAPEEGSMPSTKGGTTQDGRDMWRVGRDQELNVSTHWRGGCKPGSLANWPAQFSIPLGAGFQRRADVHLGGSVVVSQCNTNKTPR